jgi:heme A synthase
LVATTGEPEEARSMTVKRPGAVTFAVVLMYIGGIAQIALGILTIFLRYVPDVAADGVAFAVTLTGAGMILFGLFVVALASGVSRGSRVSRLSATVVVVLALALMVADLIVADDGDWSGVAIQGLVVVCVVLPLWTGAGRRYFAVR